jgi:hypothetical protein
MSERDSPEPVGPKRRRNPWCEARGASTQDLAFVSRRCYETKPKKRSKGKHGGIQLRTSGYEWPRVPMEGHSNGCLLDERTTLLEGGSSEVATESLQQPPRACDSDAERVRSKKPSQGGTHNCKLQRRNQTVDRPARGDYHCHTKTDTDSSDSELPVQRLGEEQNRELQLFTQLDRRVYFTSSTPDKKFRGLSKVEEDSSREAGSAPSVEYRRSTESSSDTPSGCTQAHKIKCTTLSVTESILPLFARRESGAFGSPRGGWSRPSRGRTKRAESSGGTVE